jgi:protein gp37
MGANSGIEWTDATWNACGGCDIDSPGCIHCYAMQLAGTRLRHMPLYAGITDATKTGPVFNGKLTVVPDESRVWTFPLRWRGSKTPRLGPGMPSTIFVGDMSDLFHDDRPEEVIDRHIAVIALSKHVGQILTKRAHRMAAHMSDPNRPDRVMAAMAKFGAQHLDDPEPWRKAFPGGMPWPLPNLWCGISAEDQPRFDRRWPDLARTPAVVRFVSYEPAVGPLTLRRIDAGIRPDWLIAGGESGRKARQPESVWFSDTRDECEDMRIAYFFKQWGSWMPHPAQDGRNAPIMIKAPKKANGRTLDGRIHGEFPIVHPAVIERLSMRSIGRLAQAA